MTYRDEKDALRARVAVLERDLGAAEQEVARLRGASDAPAAGTELTPSRWLGEPIAARFERELPHAISEAGYEAIADLLRARLGIQVAQVGGTLTAPGVFTLVRDGRTTRIALSGDWRVLRGSVISGPMLFGLFGGLPVAGVAADLATHGALSTPLHAVWIVALGMLGAGAGMRRLAQRRARERLAALRGAFEAVLDVAHAHAVGGAAPQVRIAEPSDAETELGVASLEVELPRHQADK